MQKPFSAVVYQLGIVDCCPRPLPRLVDKAIHRVPLLRGARRAKSFHPLARPWTSLAAWASNLKHISTAATQLSEKVYFLEIAPPTHNLIINCGDFAASVQRYNGVLAEAGGSFVSLWQNVDIPSYFLPDGHHLNAAGHQRVAEIVGASVA